MQNGFNAAGCCVGGSQSKNSCDTCGGTEVHQTETYLNLVTNKQSSCKDDNAYCKANDCTFNGMFDCNIIQQWFVTGGCCPKSKIETPLVNIVMDIANVDYDQLVKNPKLVKELKGNLTLAIIKVKLQDNPITVHNVNATFSKGSVKVDFSITVPSGVDKDEMASDFKSSKDDLTSGLLAAVTSTSGIDSVSSGEITIVVSNPVARVFSLKFDDGEEKETNGAEPLTVSMAVSLIFGTLLCLARF